MLYVLLDVMFVLAVPDLKKPANANDVAIDIQRTFKHYMLIAVSS